MLIEVAEDTTVDAIKENTGCEFKVSPNLKSFWQNEIYFEP